MAGRLTGLARADLPASIVVFLVALPLSLGVAVASGAPVAAGLIAAFVGGVVVAGLLGGCAIQVGGPTANLSVVVAEGVQHFGRAASQLARRAGEVYVYLATVLGVVFLNLLQGMPIGLVLAFAPLLWRVVRDPCDQGHDRRHRGVRRRRTPDRGGAGLSRCCAMRHGDNNERAVGRNTQFAQFSGFAKSLPIHLCLFTSRLIAVSGLLHREMPVRGLVPCWTC
nr:SulP family inorganic anion transporter [Nocardia abscessus]